MQKQKKNNNNKKPKQNLPTHTGSADQKIMQACWHCSTFMHTKQQAPSVSSSFFLSVVTSSYCSVLSYERILAAQQQCTRGSSDYKNQVHKTYSCLSPRGL